MKIVYIGNLFISDSEFPLYKALIESGLDIDVYLTIRGKEVHINLIDIDDVYRKDTILDSTEYESFRVFKDYFDLDRIHLVNNYHCRRRDPRSWFVAIKMMWNILRKKPDAIHFSWPQVGTMKLLYLLPYKKILTVHDPIPHSSHEDKKSEAIRKRAFREADRYLLLSEVHKNAFCERYNIEPSKIHISRFGYYNWFDCLNANDKAYNLPEKYILFWGQIQSHKGVDVLLHAMTLVHQTIPDLHCIVAGAGEFNFDISPYEELDYVEIRHRFIRVSELTALLKHCLFDVCPYKDATQSGVVQMSFSAGVPLVVTNVGNLSQIVTDGVSGLVVPPNDARSLADAIIKLSTNKELLQSFKDNIRNSWMKRMDWHEVVDDYYQLYASLCSKK